MNNEAIEALAGASDTTLKDGDEVSIIPAPRRGQAALAGGGRWRRRWDAHLKRERGRIMLTAGGVRVGSRPRPLAEYPGRVLRRRRWRGRASRDRLLLPVPQHPERAARRRIRRGIRATPAPPYYIDPARPARHRPARGAGLTASPTIYHSHIDTGAYFSETDKRNALVDGEPRVSGRGLRGGLGAGGRAPSPATPSRGTPSSATSARRVRVLSAAR